MNVEFPYCPEETVKRYLALIAGKRPVVQCITNIVTVNDCANALLAIGASPTMAHHPQEMADFAAFSDALVLNMGATESLEAMRIAGVLTHEAGHPVVIDPVGCAGSAFRRERCLALIEAVHPSCIRGNASEIRALAEHVNTGKGVDERLPEGGEDRDEKTGLSKELIVCAKELSESSGAIVIASGKTDLIVKAEEVYEVCAGSAWMPKITGAGCMLSSLLGAFLAAECSAKSAWAGCTFMAKSGEEAERRTKALGGGTGTYHMQLLDALSRGAGL